MIKKIVDALEHFVQEDFTIPVQGFNQGEPFMNEAMGCSYWQQIQNVVPVF